MLSKLTITSKSGINLYWGLLYSSITSADMAHLIDSGEFVIVQLPTEESDAGNQVLFVQT